MVKSIDKCYDYYVNSTRVLFTHMCNHSRIGKKREIMVLTNITICVTPKSAFLFFP